MQGDEQYEAAGLFDPQVDADTGRLELLHWLDEQGFSLQDMVDALEREGLGALASDVRLRPRAQLSAGDSQVRSGLDPEHFDSVVTALGLLPPSYEDEARRFTEAEVDAIALFGSLIALFSNDEALGLIRVIGTSVSRIAEAATSMFLIDVETPHLVDQGSELLLAQKVFEAIGLVDELVPVLDPVLRNHMLQSADRGRQAMISETERLMYRYAVGFVDLVGFTPISQHMSAQELSAFIREFEGRATDATTRAGARLVKLIGDEVMFVAPSVDSACRAAEQLMTGFSTGDTSVEPRGGLAYGDVLVRGGDYYGEIVNLASRLVAEAQPSELLVSRAVADEKASLAFTPAGHRALKGFADLTEVQSAFFR